MTKTINSDSPISNIILAALPFAEYQIIFPMLEEISLTYGENIYLPGEIIRYVYFPNSGIVSILAAVENSSTLEVGIVGREGIIGIPVFLGVKISINCAVVQGTGTAMRIKTEDFLLVCQKAEMLSGLLRRFTHSLLTQVSQSAVCYRFHSIEARFARWLLMTSDRMESKEFHLTQDFLANMLGVRREAVNKSAVNLQRQKLITYNRGNIIINKRRELEDISCLCYSIIKAEAESLSLN